MKEAAQKGGLFSLRALDYYGFRLGLKFSFKIPAESPPLMALL